MTGEQITLVQDSFEKVLPISDAAAALFYARLFDLDLKLESLFKGDITEQGRKLMQMIGVAVRSLNRLDEILPAVQALGARHVGYGVREKADYGHVDHVFSTKHMHEVEHPILAWLLHDVE